MFTCLSFSSASSNISNKRKSRRHQPRQIGIPKYQQTGFSCGLISLQCKCDFKKNFTLEKPKYIKKQEKKFRPEINKNLNVQSYMISYIITLNNY